MNHQLTMTALPLLYIILSLWALSFVDTPRAVVGFGGNKEVCLKDMVVCMKLRWPAPILDASG
jgi:hypothetical protein